MFKFLTTDGLIFITLGWGCVFGLLFFSIARILKNENKNKTNKN